MIEETKIMSVAAEALGCSIEALKKRTYTLCGFPVFAFENKSVVVGVRDDMMKLMLDDVISTLYEVNPEIIVEYTGCDTNWMLEAIEALQKGGEKANDSIKALVGKQETLEALAAHVLEIDRDTCVMSYLLSRNINEQGLSRLFHMSNEFEQKEIDRRLLSKVYWGFIIPTYK
jgi:hypothetical protein